VLSSLVLAAVPSLLFIGIGLTTPYWPTVVLEEFINDAWEPNLQTLQDELAAYRGSFLDQTTHRFIESLSVQMVDAPLFLFGRVGGLMLLGMALFKLGALSAEWSRRRYLAFVAAAVFVGIPVIVYGIYGNFERNWDIGALFFGIQYNYWGSYLVALGWVGLIMIWCPADAYLHHDLLRTRVRLLRQHGSGSPDAARLHHLCSTADDFTLVAETFHVRSPSSGSGIGSLTENRTRWRRVRCSGLLKESGGGWPD